MKLYPFFLLLALLSSCGQSKSKYTLQYDENEHILKISGDDIPGGTLEVNYLEAYCRANSTDADWVKHTVIPHTTDVVKNTPQEVILIDQVSDGVIVKHWITVNDRGVDFDIEAVNKTKKASEIHWAQPCVRVGKFTGYGKDVTDDDYAYIKNSFLFLDGEPAFMPTKHWATKARYTPGQVWCPKDVPRTDVNPRPLSRNIPSNGLIGCVNKDSGMVLGIAFEPYQELFQGVLRCLHSDFRIGGLKPGEIKKVRGKIYILKGSAGDLLKLYEKDFPEHMK